MMIDTISVLCILSIDQLKDFVILSVKAGKGTGLEMNIRLESMENFTTL